MFTFILLFFVSGTLSKFPDWLITDIKTPTTLRKTDEGNLILSNGLISREFTTSPDFTTVDYYSHEKQSSILRALSPEAIIGLDGVVYNVGNVKSNVSRAYLNRTALKEDFVYDEDSFHYVGYDTESPKAPYPYKPMRGAPKDIVWPPKGLRLNVYFKAPSNATYYHLNTFVCIHYEMYDGIPGMSKWVSIIGESVTFNKVNVSAYSVEILAVNQQWSQVSPWDGPYNTYKWLYVETDESHGTNVHWFGDPAARFMPGSFEPTVNVSYQVNISSPSIVLTEEGFESFHVHELAHGSSDETRRALGRHKIFRMLAPQTLENPIFFHMTRSDSKSFHETVDQLAEVGFEMLIFSFGSGFNIETSNASYIERIKEDIAYANSKGIEVGGYDLIVLDRDLAFKYMAINKHNKTVGSACLASEWYDYLLDKFTTFIDKTGLSMVETDGPYGGGTCASTDHPHHDNFNDSIYKQQLLQGKFFKELRKRNMYINQPDLYWYQGGSRTGLGYNENQYSLPRWQDLSVSRQTLYDRLYVHIPTSGWMFLPLTLYHGGGDAAEFEPLHEHLMAYKFGLAQYLGAGVAACYRGYRIYDTNETKALVMQWVSFYKNYRDIVTSDIVRVRRPDMQSIDSYMHVNYKLENKALAMVFNPTLEYQSMNLTLPLYYTGIKNTAAVSERGSGFIHYKLDMGWEIDVLVNLPPLEITWFLVKDGEQH